MNLAALGVCARLNLTIIRDISLIVTLSLSPLSSSDLNETLSIRHDLISPVLL